MVQGLRYVSLDVYEQSLILFYDMKLLCVVQDLIKDEKATSLKT